MTRGMQVIKQIRAANPTVTRPAVVLVPRDETVVPVVNVLRSQGLDAADGRSQELASVRVYPKGEALRAMAHACRFSPEVVSPFFWA